MSKVYHNLSMWLFVLILAGLVAWSWVLVDPNFTLYSHADWTSFREYVISIGYFDRPFSSMIFVVLILSLTVSSLLFVRIAPKNILFFSLVVAFISAIMSYPALSHDLFNYIFDARIFTYYGQNPYLHKALDFPADPMLRFMHWVHRAYPYGPTYLFLSLIPSFLGFGKFTATFFLFKLGHGVLFVVTAMLLSRMNKLAALIFVSSPLVIVEGLINTHNDFVALSLAIIGIYLVKNKNRVWGSVALIFGGLIKYISLPSLVMLYDPKKDEKVHFFGKQICFEEIQKILQISGLVVLTSYVVSQGEIHPWYFLNLFIILPFFPRAILYLTPFFTGLLLSYYPYVQGGEWGQGGDVAMKRVIVYWSIVANIAVVVIVLLWRRYAVKNQFSQAK